MREAKSDPIPNLLAYLPPFGGSKKCEASDRLPVRDAGAARNKRPYYAPPQRPSRVSARIFAPLTGQKSDGGRLPHGANSDSALLRGRLICVPPPYGGGQTREGSARNLPSPPPQGGGGQFRRKSQTYEPPFSRIFSPRGYKGGKFSRKGGSPVRGSASCFPAPGGPKGGYFRA